MASSPITGAAGRACRSRGCSGHPRVSYAAPKRWMPATSAGMTIDLSPLALDADLDQIWPVGRHRFRQRRRDVVGLVDAHGVEAHALGEAHEIQRRPHEIHLLVGMLRTGLEVLAPDVDIMLKDAIFAVGEDHEHDRKLVVGCAPERLDR